jgi:hypothetical protein
MQMEAWNNGSTFWRMYEVWHLNNRIDSFVLQLTAVVVSWRVLDYLTKLHDSAVLSQTVTGI